MDELTFMENVDVSNMSKKISQYMKIDILSNI